MNKKIFFLFFGFLMLNANSFVFSMHKRSSDLGTKHQLLAIAKTLYCMALSHDFQRESINNNWQLNDKGEPTNQNMPQELIVDTKDKIGYDKENPATYMPQVVHEPDNKQISDPEKPIIYSITKIQEYAIQQYKKKINGKPKKNLTWSEKNPFKLAALIGFVTGAAGLGIGWISKSLWESRK